MKLNAAKGAFAESSLITLKDENWLTNQRVAGRVAAGALSLLENEVKQGTNKSLLELDKLAETYIRDNGCTPTFLLYKGFPNSVCMSIGNIKTKTNMLVHGIPTNIKLEQGMKFSADLGTTFNGAIADTALTCVFGEASVKQAQIIKDTEEALMRGIQAIKIGSRLGVIGKAIYKFGSSKGYGVINNYGGHGLDLNCPHSQPFVANRSTENDGPRLAMGETLAIEPMLTSGSVKTHVDADGWTVHSEAEYSAHFEHTIFIKNNGDIELITDRENL